MAKLSKKPNPKRFNLDDSKEATKNIEAKKHTNNKENVNSKERVKLTTMINPVLRDELKILAMKRRCNFSDVLEDAIREYLKK